MSYGPSSCASFSKLSWDLSVAVEGGHMREFKPSSAYMIPTIWISAAVINRIKQKQRAGAAFRSHAQGNLQEASL
jgi:hypothetical protein